MRALLTGQVGLDKADYLEAARSEAGCSSRMRVWTLGEVMIDSYEGRIDDATILNLPKALLGVLRKLAWAGILSEVGAKAEVRDEIQIVNGHAVFRWHHGLFPAIDLDPLLQFDPDVLITLIDDVHRVAARLEARGTPFFQLWELLAWREEEVWLTRFLAESLSRITERKIPFYVIPKTQGPALLCRLLLEPAMSKVYLSFAATGVPAGSDEQAEIDNFKERVSEAFIAFDPLALGERAIISTALSLTKEMDEEIRIHSGGKVSDGVPPPPTDGIPATGRRRPYWDDRSALGLMEFEHEGQILSGREVGAILDIVDSQIISRDYLLIDQSDFVVLRIGADEDGQPKISAGSQSEMIYAYSIGKPVYVVFEGGSEALSPWVTEFSKCFTTLDEAFGHLSSTYL